jgi:hypothetical protein
VILSIFFTVTSHVLKRQTRMWHSARAQCPRILLRVSHHDAELGPVLGDVLVLQRRAEPAPGARALSPGPRTQGPSKAHSKPIELDPRHGSGVSEPDMRGRGANPGLARRFWILSPLMTQLNAVVFT